MIKVAGSAVIETKTLLADLYPSAHGDFFECNEDEGAAAFLHRFATAGAAVRYRAVNSRSTGGLVALDVALPRNEADWVERLPDDLNKLIVQKLYYGHFFCHVFHQVYLVRPGVDWLDTEHKILSLLDARNARLRRRVLLQGRVHPSTHNLGTNRMSEIPQDGVVNKWGQTHDIKNLFVSDGSQFTTGGAENPTLTIVSLAIRQAEYIANQMSTGTI